MAGYRHGVAGAVAVLVATAGVTLPAAASAPPSGWNGENPFSCTIQNAGFGTAVPHPEADPYCVEFDKRRQNATELGVADFLSKEPARVASASNKCFYFQTDHWRGSVVQGDPRTKTYEFDGHYFFDKARGEGGVWVTNFSFNGKTQDPSAIPGLPADQARYFGPGTGGFITHDQVEADPACVARAKRDGASIYVRPDRGPARGCLGLHGPARRRGLGPVALGTTETAVRARLGEPNLVKRGYLRWCLLGGGSLAVGQIPDRSGSLGKGQEQTALVLTSGRAYRAQRVGPGMPRAALRRSFPHAVRRANVGRTVFYAVRRGSPVLVALRGSRVRFLAVYDPRRIRTTRALRTLLGRAR